MIDLSHEWGGDLAVNSTGDIALARGPDVTRQRISRRLLTNPGDYLWNLGFGGGLATFVGLTTSPSDIEAVTRNQLEQETAVAATPAPTVGVQMIDSANGYVAASITYTEASNGKTIKFNLNVNS